MIVTIIEDMWKGTYMVLLIVIVESFHCMEVIASVIGFDRYVEKVTFDSKFWFPMQVIV